jgi:chemotaxis protein CheD
MTSFIGNEITYLLPGQLIVTGEALKISTILGSCVSVCLYDPHNKISGMNHYLLPLKNDRSDNRFRFGDVSLEYMLDEIMYMGATKRNLLSYVYGGSSMFGSSYSYNIGRQNINVAFEFLEFHSIPVQESCTGGDTGRKVLFDTSAGIVTRVFVHSKSNKS